MLHSLPNLFLYVKVGLVRKVRNLVDSFPKAKPKHKLIQYLIFS